MANYCNLPTAYKDPDSQEWIVLVQVVADGQELDKCPANSSWNATVQERFERLLRSSQIPTGILWNGEALRLVYAPRGESSGHLTFPPRGDGRSGWKANFRGTGYAFECPADV